MQANYKIEPVLQHRQFPVREALEEGFNHWYWFVAAVLATLALGYLYIRITPAEYRVQALIMIDNAPRTTSQLAGGEAALAGMDDLASTNAAVKGMYVLKSGRLMQEVVQRLGLQIQYTNTGRFQDRDLYQASPVHLQPVGNIRGAARFLLQVLHAGRVQFSGFVIDDRPVAGVWEGAPGQAVTTPAGSFRIQAVSGDSGRMVKVTVADAVDAANYYKNGIEAVLDDERAGAIRLLLTDNSYSKAADIVNTLIAVYNEYAIGDKNQIARNTASFIKDRLDRLSGELGGVDEAIATYKKNNQLTDIDAEASALLDNTSEVQGDALQLRTQAALVDMLLATVKDPQTANALLPVGTGVAGDHIDDLLTGYDETLLQRNHLLENAGNKSPVIQDLNKKLADNRNAILGALQNLQRATNLQLKGLDARQQVIDRKLALLPGQEKDLQTIFRQQKVKEELYLLLLQKREENALNLATAASNASVVDYAAGSRTPVFPNRLAVLSFALFAGLALPAGILYVQRHLDMKVRSRKEIELQTTIPFIGIIPQHATAVPTAIAMGEASKDPVSEAFRIVRSNIGFLVPAATGSRVIMVTSTVSGEGKTFVSANLAMSFALAGFRVILVNADIRKTSAAKPGMDHRCTGLSDYLSGQITEWQKLVRPSDLHPALAMIASGPLPPNPAELLMSRRLEELIAALKECYDYIILDSVPLGIVADAGIVNRVCDLTIYVIREGVPDRRMLPEIEQLFQHKKLNSMAILLNGASPGSLHYGYGYGYGN